ncbi:hypothetical protein C8R46DRAFT_602837 [Mycena filopes]|nr:hypothetical protein C8R46DRAFT_602837 [Mycena filopes]
MSSLDALNARIQQLSVAISDLEIQRSSARRKLNILRDPMARLPLEISSEIFIQLHLADDDGSTPIQLLRICHLWQDIALSTPSLWAIVHSDMPAAPRFYEGFQTWLARARNAPLSITLRGDIAPDVGAVLKQHALHLQTLQLTLDSPGELLEEMSLTSLPILQKLSIEATEWGLVSYIWNCVATMHAAPFLTDFEVIGMRAEDPDEIYHGPSHLTHSSLQQLRLGSPGQLPSSSCLLAFLTLPSLEHLLIAWLDIPYAELRSFFRRSASPLQSLYMELDPESDVECDWVPLVPSLVSLTLVMRHNRLPVAGDPIPILDQMARDTDILPNLLDLSITCWPATDEDYADLITVLTRRASQRTQLRSFQLIFCFSDPAYPGAECRRPNSSVLEALRKFVVKERIQIHLGPQEENYLWYVDDSGSESGPEEENDMLYVDDSGSESGPGEENDILYVDDSGSESGREEGNGIVYVDDSGSESGSEI